MIKTPDYIKGVVKPNGSKGQSERKVWSIGLETVWLRFFTACNLNGDTEIPHDVMGAPLRVAMDEDGLVKLNKHNRPVVKVAKEMSDQIRLAKENYIAGLVAFTHEVYEDDPDGFAAQIEAQTKAGKPILDRDSKAIKDTYRVLAEADKVAKDAEKVAMEAEAKAEKEAKAKAETEKVAVR